MNEGNVYPALRAGFPADLRAIAIETANTEPALHYSWADLEHGSARIANLLHSLGLPAHSRVAVQVEKSPEAVMLYLAVRRAGHVFVPLNTAYQAEELAHFLSDAEPAVFVCTPERFGRLSKPRLPARCGLRLHAGRCPQRHLAGRAALHSDQQQPVDVPADALAAILYTSGTTGRSKGACLSHANLGANARTLHTHWGFDAPPTGGEVLLHALPIFHVHGLFVALHAALLSGTRLLWFNRFDAAAVLRRLPEATVFMGVPTLYTRLLALPHLNAAACQRLRLFISGSAPLLPDTFAQWQQRTGHTILERYGMSETLMLTSNPWQPASGRRLGSVGLPLPGVGVRVQAAAGEVGGIEVRGPSVFSAYWRLPEKTAEEFTPDGWFRTVTSAASMPTVTCTSWAAARTWSSAAASTSTRPRWRRCSSPSLACRERRHRRAAPRLWRSRGRRVDAPARLHTRPRRAAAAAQRPAGRLQMPQARAGGT